MKKSVKIATAFILFIVFSISLNKNVNAKYDESNLIKKENIDIYSGVYAKLYYMNGMYTLVLNSTPNFEYEGKLIDDYDNQDNSLLGKNSMWTKDNFKINKVVILNNIRPLTTAYWFNGCNNLSVIENIYKLNTSKSISMRAMFNNCSNLTELDVSRFNTSRVTNMYYMFNNCEKLTILDVSNFETSNVKTMSNMFGNCRSLQNLELKKWNTEKVTSMTSMFENCSNLIQLNLNSFNTGNVGSMRYMFNNCTNLERIEIESFNTSNVESMYAMFNNCEKLEELDISSFETNKVTNTYRMFALCHNLRTIYATEFFELNSETESINMFLECNSLVGGNGTSFIDKKISDYTYARIDSNEEEGYFTNKITNNRSFEPRTYYVSSNGKSKIGTSANNPMSLETANSKTFYNNEKVLLKCGDTFYGDIKFSIEADDNSRVYIGNYGTGQKPIISGAHILDNTDAWVKVKDDIYKLNLSEISNFSGLGNNYKEPYNIGFIEDDQGNIYGNRKQEISKLENEFDFYCENEFIYVKASKNALMSLGKIRLPSRNNLVKIKSNTIMDGIIIQDTGAHGIAKGENEVKNVQIKNCIIQNIGGSVQIESSFTRYGNGIEFWNQLENTIVENCIIRNVYDAGYTIQSNVVETGFYNNICRNNVFINCTYTLEVFCYNKNTGYEGEIKGFDFSNNTSINCGRGWGYEARSNKYKSAEFVFHTIKNNNGVEINISGNKSYNARRLYFITGYTIRNVNRDMARIIQSHNNDFFINCDTIVRNTDNNDFENIEDLQKLNLEEESNYIKITQQDVDYYNNKYFLSSNNLRAIINYYNNSAIGNYETSIEETEINPFEETYEDAIDKKVNIENEIDSVKDSIEFKEDNQDNNNTNNKEEKNEEENKCELVMEDATELQENIDFEYIL